MDEFEKSDSEKKKTNDSHNTFYQNATHYKEKENAFIKKNYKCGQGGHFFRSSFSLTLT